MTDNVRSGASFFPRRQFEDGAVDSLTEPEFRFDNMRLALTELKDRWWLLLLRGVLIAAIGVLMILEPEISLRTWIFVIGAFAIADGVFAGLTGLRRLFGEGSWWPYMFQAVISLGFGFLAIVYPELTAKGLLYVVAAWSIVIGGMRVLTGFRVRKAVEGEFWIILSGLLWVGLGILLLVLNPADGLLGLLIAAGVLLIVNGIVDVISAWRLRSLDVDGIVTSYEQAASLSIEAMNKILDSSTKRR